MKESASAVAAGAAHRRAKRISTTQVARRWRRIASGISVSGEGQQYRT